MGHAGIVPPPRVMVTTSPPNEIRSALSEGLLRLLVNSSHESRLLTDDELEWAIASLLWINHHPGRTSGRSLFEGTGLVEELPERATR